MGNALEQGSEWEELVSGPSVGICLFLVAAAVIFFAGYWIYMIFMTWMAITGEGELSASSTIIKQLATILCGIALIIFVVLSEHQGDLCACTSRTSLSFPLSLSSVV